MLTAYMLPIFKGNWFAVLAILTFCKDITDSVLIRRQKCNGLTVSRQVEL